MQVLLWELTGEEQYLLWINGLEIKISLISIGWMSTELLVGVKVLSPFMQSEPSSFSGSTQTPGVLLPALSDVSQRKSGISFKKTPTAMHSRAPWCIHTMQEHSIDRDLRCTRPPVCLVAGVG